MIRRLVVIGWVVALLLGQALPSASAADIEQLLESAHAAEYSGRQLVLTEWAGESALDTFDIQQFGGVAIVTGDGGETYVGGGRVLNALEGVAVDDYSQPVTADRYEFSDLTSVSYLGRRAEQLDVFETNRLRASIVFDVETGAVLSTEVFDVTGDRFRTAYMVSFSPRTSLPIPLVGKLEGEFDVLLPETPDDHFPLNAAGYVRADSYTGQDSTVHAFYTDGLFSFSVFKFDGAIQTDHVTDLMFERGGTEYDVLVSATDLTVLWKVDGATYVLIGDLPPDHLEQTLDALPQGRGLFGRIWQGLFG